MMLVKKPVKRIELYEGLCESSIFFFAKQTTVILFTYFYSLAYNDRIIVMNW